ncbi:MULTISPECIES: hypothetical protein [unclassified Neorhizobium]|uniref:hypothetical protein n=1 Tax=unclassified Neorhizobium TaxID=2629175 RepID=UPI001FF5110E|nr:MULTISPECIES: hypothetical protein [unclassified Neorhizobium]MCJ9670378.1 hypothetical protein [Neorhizobium sp. SHOUNA12B]MCJ9746308.1 hypothetical protein [Neorhizobium sp. SHOUNA12A]
MMGWRNALNSVDWVTCIGAWNPRDDRLLPGQFADENWIHRVKVNTDLVATYPKHIKDRLKIFENKEDAVFKRILGQGEVQSPFSKKIVWKQPEPDARFRSKVTWHLRIILSAWYFWPLIVALLTLPNLSFGLIGEKIFNVRSVPTSSFITWQLFPLLFGSYQVPSVCAQFIREQAVGPVTTSIWFAPLGFDRDLRHFYYEQAYLIPACVFGILLQICAQFAERFWYRFWLNRRISKKGLTTSFTQTVNECTRLRGVLNDLTEWTKPKKLSKTTKLALSVTRRGIRRKIDFLDSALPPGHRYRSTQSFSGAFFAFFKNPKSYYSYANGIILFGNAFFYLRAWGTFFQALGYATVMEINTFLMVTEDEQLIDDLVEFTTNTVSGLFGQMFFVAIPYRATKETAVEDYRYFIMLGLQLTYVMIFSGKTVPFLIEWVPRICKYPGKMARYLW